MAEQISNGDVLNFNKVHGKNKCLEFLIDSKALADGCNEQPSARAISFGMHVYEYVPLYSGYP